jgi:hypothetical protein
VHYLAREILFLVTFEADLVAFGAQQVRRIGCVRIVAGGARAPRQGRMHSSGVESQVFDAVAFITDLVALLLQEELADNAVSKMAIFALSVLEDFVNVRHRKVLLDGFCVAIQAVFALEFALLRMRRGREARQRDAEAEQARPRAHEGSAPI